MKDDSTRWELMANEFKILFWVSDVFPLSFAHATEGKIFREIIEFDNPTVAILASARIVSTVSEPTGTTFELSMA